MTSAREQEIIERLYMAEQVRASGLEDELRHVVAERDRLRDALRDLCAALDGWTGGSSPWLEAFCAGNEALSLSQLEQREGE